jgi:hypothetical protein
VYFADPPAAHAYIDPGTAAYTFQLMIGGILGLLFAFRSFVARVLKQLAELIGLKKRDGE